MKFSKVILVLVLFFTSFSFIYAFNGTSSNYNLNFNMGHSIVLYDNTTNSTHNSAQLITIKPYSTNYFTRAGNVFFDFAMSTYYNTPQFSVLNIQDGNDYNLTKLAINITGEFFKDIEVLNYSIDGIYFDLTDSVSQRALNAQLDLKNYGSNEIIFHFTDIYGIPGSHTLTINAILNLPSLINDSDADGISDINDTIYGNVSNINTNINTLTLEVDSDENLSRLINDTYNTTFKSSGTTIIEFSNNYSSNPINLSQVIIKEENIVNNSKLLVNGLDLEVNNTKIVYLNLSGNTTIYGSLCLKDEEIFSFTQITPGCNGSNEYYIRNIPHSLGDYGIDYTVSYVNSLNNSVKISGLNHSGVEQICTEDWEYRIECIAGKKIRSAIDANNCGTTVSRLTLGNVGQCSSGSTGGGGGSFTLYEPPIEEDENTTTTSSSNNNNQVIEIPTSNNVEDQTDADQLANNQDDLNQDLDSNSNQEEKTPASTINVSDYTTYIFAAVGFIVLIGLVLFIKNNLPVKQTKVAPPVQLSTFDRDCKVAKEYVKKYKLHYQSDEIYRELEKAGYSHEVINKVFDEEF